MISIVVRFTQYQIVRYLIGGGTAALISLSAFYCFHSVVGVYYLTASIMAFAVAFFVSWAFHKFWTFREHSMDNLHKQGSLFFFNSLFGLALNTLILYICVTFVHARPLAGQIAAAGLTACCTFFISKHLVFQKKGMPVETE